MLLIVVVATSTRDSCWRCSPGGNGGSSFVAHERFGCAAEPLTPAETRMYSTAEADPLVTGQLYSGPRAAGTGQRWIYGGRTSHGQEWGLREFSTGVSGQAGVDVGLLGMQEYGRPDVFDDGIPENWQLPSTPVHWYVPAKRDYYDVRAQQPGVYEENLTPLQEPDHEVLFN